MNASTRIAKVIRTLGLMGIMMALAASLGSASTTSAASPSGNVPPMPGKLIVYASAISSTNALTPISVSVRGEQNSHIFGGVVNNNTPYGVKLPEGVYEVMVSAPGFETQGETVKVANGGLTQLKFELNPIAIPPLRAGK